jgi:UDP-glucose 4-epimerase
LAAGRPVTIYGDGEQRRDFVHVADVVSAIVAMLDAEVVGGTWNVGSGTSISVNELLQSLESAAGRTAEHRHAPERSGELRNSRLNIERIRADLGWEPRLSLADGLRTVIGQA